MRYAILFLTAALYAQTTPPPGTVAVSATITATAGTLVCTATASVAATASTMHMKCVDGADVVLPDIDFVVKAPGSTTYSVQRGGNTITWLLTKGNPVPDQWQVTANGVMKSGTF
jgi:hypothetical protein